VLSLDIALGVGGYPKGRIIEIVGQEASGKTTLVLHAIAEVQKSGGTAAFIDAEHALDPRYASNLGVDLDRLLFSQPDSGEHALEICEDLVSTGAVSLVVVDSVAALTPKSELDGEMGDAQMGAHARLMSQAMRKLTGITSKTNTTIMFINQYRQKIGVMYGNPNVATGGNALKFYASQRLEVVKTKGEAGPDGKVVSSGMKVKVIKNKVAPPFSEAELEIIWGQGIDKLGDLIALGTQHKFITVAGSWMECGNERHQGFNTFREALKLRPDLQVQLRKEIITKVGL